MAFVPQLFMANMALHGDFSKVSKFAAYIDPPTFRNGGLLGALASAAGEVGEKILGAVNTIGLSFQCEVAELPGYNINTIESKIYGSSYYVPATPVFNELNLTFICSGTLWEKKFFDDWMDWVLPKKTNNEYGYLANYPDECVGGIKIVQFSEIGIPSYIAKFKRVFPYTMQPLQTNWADDGVHRLTVGFRYREWERVNLVANLLNSLKSPDGVVGLEPMTAPPQNLLGPP